MQEKACLPMDEKHLFHAIAERMEKYDLRERSPCPPGFQSPAKASDGQAFIQRVVKGLRHALQGTRDGLPNGRPQDRGNGIDDRPWRLSYGRDKSVLDVGSQNRR
jgi:hypothetical protein